MGCSAWDVMKITPGQLRAHIRNEIVKMCAAARHIYASSDSLTLDTSVADSQSPSHFCRVADGSSRSTQGTFSVVGFVHLSPFSSRHVGVISICSNSPSLLGLIVICGPPSCSMLPTSSLSLDNERFTTSPLWVFQLLSISPLFLEILVGMLVRCMYIRIIPMLCMGLRSIH